MRPRGSAKKYKNMTREIADKIREEYWIKKVKQKDLAERYGMAQGSISRIINEWVWV